jgi:hypothetical protein
MWLLVDRDDDQRQLVLGQLYSDPVVVTDMKRGQLLAVSYRQVRDHGKPSDFQTVSRAIFRFGRRKGPSEIDTKIT